MAAYSVTTGYRDNKGQEFIDKSTVVYASTDGAARSLGATALGVSIDKVKVVALGGAGGMNPDAQIIGRQAPDSTSYLNVPPSDTKG